MDTRRYFAIGDREDLSYEEKLDAYRGLTDEYFEVERYQAFCAEHLPNVDEAMVEYIASDEFDGLLVDTVRTTFPRHQHEHFVAHYRGLLGAWVHDRERAAL